MREIILFCLPYAGGSSEAIYLHWKKNLDQSIELYPLELAGRGKRSEMAMFNSMEELVDDLFNTVIKQMKECTPYAFFGHSMGSIIAYLLALKLKKTSDIHSPSHLFLSGGTAPHLKKNTNIHSLDANSFKKEILKLGGTPVEIFENKFLFDTFVPVLRQDYRLIETYKCSKIEQVNCGMSILFGEDELCNDDIGEWKKYSSASCEFYQYPGGHFFINHHSKNIVRLINRKMKEIERIIV